MQKKTIMLRLIFIIILFVCFDFCSIGQNREEIGAGIYNKANVLKTNKVSSITFIDFMNTNQGEKVNPELGKITKVELYDSLGRNTEEWHYNDSTGQIVQKNIYFFSDTSLIYNRIERYNEKDSLIRIDYKKDIISVKPLMLFSYYKFKYEESGLIKEAVFFYNQCGSCEKSMFEAIRLTRLKYSFYQ
jgi:hypothetical protein